MKKIFISFLALILGCALFAQDQKNVTAIIEEGIILHDKRDFVGAIKKYNQALEIDENNIIALAEKAFSLFESGDYNGTIEVCKEAIERKPESNDLRAVYTAYGNALDLLKRPNEAVEIYDKGISMFPDNYQLYYNKGISLSGINKINEALDCFHKSATINPNHASSHNAIGRLLSYDNTIPSILALCRFMILEPQGYRAKENLPFIKQVISSNVNQTGKKKVTIYMNPSKFPNEEEKGKVENNFRTTEFTLSLKAALDVSKENRNKKEVELFREKIETICSSLEEGQKDNFGFYWEYYVPYFLELNKKNFTETLSYLVFASSEEKQILKWLEQNQDKIDEFYKWSSSYKWN